MDMSEQPATDALFARVLATPAGVELLAYLRRRHPDMAAEADERIARARRRARRET